MSTKKRLLIIYMIITSFLVLCIFTSFPSFVWKSTRKHFNLSHFDKGFTVYQKVHTKINLFRFEHFMRVPLKIRNSSLEHTSANTWKANNNGKLTNHPNINKTFTHCQKMKFANPSLLTTALASFPGSGNTWIRHLIQEATGIFILIKNFGYKLN